MNTFISYASKNKRTAGKIKKHLDKYGFNCFLAHEDIPPQTEWPSEIVNALEQCDLFLPLLTPSFITSFYCQQETGYAYCREVEILPVMIPNDPMGMIADMQAIKFNKKRFESSCWGIVKHIAKNDSFSKPVLNALIKEFGESDTYDVACKRAEKILNEFNFTKRQVITIRKYIKKNSQIHETKEARDSIIKFMDKYSSQFNDDFRDWYNSKKASRRHIKY